MKNTPTLKSQSKVDSPKTPGGISKSLLTPCRRVGLSRNWKKSGPSPFISPLAGNSEVKVEKIEPRKRKKRHDDEELPSGSSDTTVPKDVHIDEDDSSHLAPKIENIETTPSRNVSTPQRKKSKTLLTSRIVHKECSLESPKATNEFVNKANTTSVEVSTNTKIIEDSKKDLTDVVTPVRSKSKGKITRIKSTVPETVQCVDSKENVSVSENISNELNKNMKQKSPENLTKECIVVIQKKIFKKDIRSIEKDKPKQETALPKPNPVNPTSQTLFDSDSDDVPLIALNKNELIEEKSVKVIPVDDDDDDFDNTCKIKVKKLVDKTTSIGDLRSDSNKKKCKEKQKATTSKCKEVEPKICTESKPSSQSSIDDDDFVNDNRCTILIRKSYEKVTKPTKAKSTGSITLKDIEDLRDRIEVKKKLLLAKATEDSKELRDLIKKWQKGCQDALMELMELMKNKFPDKQKMDYAEILQTLKIPSSLVGYDEDNDCFNTPTDENIILSKFNT